ncbi:proline-rich receptor-like protein kinase PERK8 [Malania oleifera]|uniref:proline-rich receptor-like protein kinase PERK8 n=1 Tax=Malania oleifera TaxID=397392 RepID=UPI0025AE311B|nr:proline-rich receptor-like protein kinase PERK8 [Malania oleifera]
MIDVKSSNESEMEVRTEEIPPPTTTDTCEAGSPVRSTKSLPTPTEVPSIDVPSSAEPARTHSGLGPYRAATSSAPPPLVPPRASATPATPSSRAPPPAPAPQTPVARVPPPLLLCPSGHLCQAVFFMSPLRVRDLMRLTGLMKMKLQEANGVIGKHKAQLDAQPSPQCRSSSKKTRPYSTMWCD